MTLEEFATVAGVKVVDCDPSWGGTYAYTTDDNPQTTVCGFRTERAALRRWADDSFGAGAGRAVMALLKASRRKTQRKPARRAA